MGSLIVQPQDAAAVRSDRRRASTNAKFPIAHEASNRERQVGQHPTILDHYDPALQFDQVIDGQGHVRLVVAGHDQIVAVMADTRCDGAVKRAETGDPALADVAVEAMPLEHGELENWLIRFTPYQMIGEQREWSCADHRCVVPWHS